MQERKLPLCTRHAAPGYAWPGTEESYRHKHMCV